MHRSLHAGKIVILALALVLSSLLLTTRIAFAEDGCPQASEVKAKTQADLDAMRVAKYDEGYIKIGACWDPKSKDIGADAAKAKQELNGMWCNPRDKCGGEVATVEDLDGQYAVCLADFIKKYRERDPSTCIFSAYRTASMQTCKCGSGGTGCLPGGRSNHQKGIAADLKARNYDDMQAAVRSYPGLRHLTIDDKPHVEADSSGKCGIGVAGPNDGPPQQSPIQGMMSALQNLFSPQPMPPAPITPISPAYDPTQYFSTTTASTSSSVSDTIQISDTYPTSTPKAVSDLLAAIAGDTSPSATSTATGTPIALIDALRNRAGLSVGNAPSAAGTNTIAVASLTPNNTFTTQDLSKTPVQNVLRGNSTFVLLEALRQTLIRLLTILKPFGGRTSVNAGISTIPGQLAE